MKRNNAKGFTIVELVIVIAVIAILAAVLIPTFTSLTNKAHESNDKALVRNLNVLLKAHQFLDGRPTIVDDAIAVAEKNGYHVTDMTPTSDGNLIIWDEDENEFVLAAKDKIEGNEDTPANRLWILTDNYDSSKAEYAQYLRGEVTGTVKVKAGLSVGKNENVNVSYENLGDDNKGVEETVTIVMNGGTLTVNNPKATMDSHGMKNVVNVINVDNSNCYHEWGIISNLLEVHDGRIALEANSVIGTMHFESDDISIEVSASATIENKKISFKEGLNQGKLALAFGNTTVLLDLEFEIGDGIGAAYFSGGNGSKNFPYLIANADQFKNIYTVFQKKGYDNKLYYKLVADFDARRMMRSGSFACVTPYIYNSVIDGNGHTITAYDDDNYWPCLALQVSNSEIKNLNVVNLKGPMFQYLMDTTVMDNVNVSGNYVPGNNTGAYTMFVWGGNHTIKNSTVDLSISTGATSQHYNAMFIGQVAAAGGAANLTFENCTARGRISSGRASVLIANACAKTTVIVNNCNIDQTTVQATYMGNDYAANQYCSIGYGNVSLTIDGKAVAMADRVLGGTFIHGPEDAKLALSVAADGHFVITPSQNEKVAYYTISYAIYANLVDDLAGTRVFMVTQKVTDPAKVDLQKLGFVGLEFVEEHGLEVYNGTFTDERTDAPIQLVDYQGKTYIVVHEDDLTLKGDIKQSNSASVTAYDEEGNIIGSAALN